MVIGIHDEDFREETFKRVSRGQKPVKDGRVFTSFDVRRNLGLEASGEGLEREARGGFSGRNSRRSGMDEW